MTAMITRNWLKHGFWNTLEQGFTRALDALSTFVLVWALDPEAFAKLALAQAWVAPALLLFLSPESVMYRDFGLWKQQGGAAVAGRIRALRAFGWLKIVLAIAISLAWTMVSGKGSEWFYASLWAFALVLAPQVMAADREFLRLDLKLKELNLHTLLQKLTLLGGTVAAAVSSRTSLGGFVVAAAVALFVPALVILFRVETLFRREYSAADLASTGGIRYVDVWSHSIRGFSLWNHLNGILWGWVQTMDLLFLGGVAGAREVGLYASTLKVANLVQAGPQAIQNIFQVWLGRRSPEDPRDPEIEKFRKMTLAVTFLVLVQWGVLCGLAPWILSVLSRGRWSPSELELMKTWLVRASLGFSILAIGLMGWAWLIGRMDVKGAFFKVFLPFLGLCLAVFYGASRGGDIGLLAWSRVPLALGFLALFAVFMKKSAR